jgi:outer membrane usher protein
MVDFKSKQGRALIVRIHLSDGKPAPFGAQVFNAKGEALGVVGQAGLALLRGVDGSGHLDVQWQEAEGAAQACGFSYAVPASSKAATAYQQIQVTCTSGNSVAQATMGTGT